MRRVSVALVFLSLLLSISDAGFAQGPCPPEACPACESFCDDLCAPECINCVILPAPAGCQGTDIPISDHSGYVLAGGLFIVSAFFMRWRKVVVKRVLASDRVLV